MSDIEKILILLEALTRYGRHHSGCPLHCDNQYVEQTDKCSCGLDDVVNKVSSLRGD